MVRDVVVRPALVESQPLAARRRGGDTTAGRGAREVGNPSAGRSHHVAGHPPAGARVRVAAMDYRLLALLLLAVGCGTSGPTAHHWPGDAAWQTTLQPGDYVVYRYTGSYTPAPVLLAKEVVESRQDLAVIDVVATRGQERRHWIEVVAGRPTDVKPGHVVELYEVDGTTRRRLRNLGNQDLDRLYDWTVAMPDRASSNAIESPEVASLERWAFACTKAYGETAWRGAVVKVSSTTCAEFPWVRWEQGVWTEDDTLANLEIVETGRGGYAQVACPEGTRHVRTKDFNAIVETCTRADGARHGPWQERDGHGNLLVAGQYVDGEKDGLWSDDRYWDVEQCMFDDGHQVGHRRPWDWTHLRLGAGFGGGYDVATGKGVGSVLAQVGWDVWSARRHCFSLPVRKIHFTGRSVAAIADMHLFVHDDDPTYLLRLGLQGYAGRADALELGYFASAGVIVSPQLGLGASIGFELIIMRIEARYDHLGGDDHLLSLNIGISDSLLAGFD